MPQHLQTTSPSPTTISYTVSSSPPLTSLPSKLLFALSTSIRLSLLSWSLWTLYLSSTCLLLPTWKPPSTCFPPSPIPTGWAFFTLEIPLTNTLLHLLGWNPPSSSSSSSSSSARATLLSALLPPSLALATLFFSLKRPHKTESLLVLHTLGIQTSSSSKFFGFGPQTRFVPTSEIQDVFIHEGFTRSVGLGREVRYYLGVVMKEGGEGVWVVFPNLLPRLEIVEEVWRGARACLFEGEADARGKKRKEMERTESRLGKSVAVDGGREGGTGSDG